MKTKLLSTLVLILFTSQLFSQCEEPLVTKLITGNEIAGMVSNGGDLFFDGDRGYFLAPAEVVLPLCDELPQPSPVLPVGRPPGSPARALWPSGLPLSGVQLPLSGVQLPLSGVQLPLGVVGASALLGLAVQ